MRQAAAGNKKGLKLVHLCVWRIGIKRCVSATGRGRGPDRARRSNGIALRAGRAADNVRVKRHLRRQQGNELRSAYLTKISQRQPLSLARMHHTATLTIWKREGAFTIPSVDCSEQREEGRVLTYRQELAIAEGPALGRKVKRKKILTSATKGSAILVISLF